MSQWYRQDLAYIHDVGHSDYALKSAPSILKTLAQCGIPEGWIVDFGCGSGWSAEAFVQAGYRVLGVDSSAALIAIARDRVPQADFQVGSMYEVDIPPCQAVTSIGECLNYWSSSESHAPKLQQLFQRVYQALTPGGVFMFDMAEPGQVTVDGCVKGFAEGADWIVLLEKSEQQNPAILTRRIVTLRQVGDVYRRDDECHQLQLYPAETLATALRQIGFKVQIQRRYSEFTLPPAHAVLVAQKPPDLQDNRPL
ncbi:MAG: class I SAM-dependent methyltransferase [Leptolyngbya sp. SIO1D8]|nr:class I SAM-dependent methyltransferase [Leptolyngbya sp. SIO1D8]